MIEQFDYEPGRFLRLPGGVPSHDTFNRLFQALDPVAFAEAFAQWAQGLLGHVAGEVVALDGKAARRATAAGQSPRHLVSAWPRRAASPSANSRSAEKSNEITAVRALLRQLELAGCIVTADALHYQKTIAKEIIEADADYVLALKGNQAAAFAEVKAFLDDAQTRRQAPRTGPPHHRRKRPRPPGNPPLLAKRRDRLVRRPRRLARAPQRRPDGGRARNGRQNHRGTPPLPEQPAGGRRPVRPRRARPLGRREPMPLGVGRRLRPRPGPGSHRPRRGHLGLLRRLALNLLRRDKTCQRGAKGKQLNAALKPHYLLSPLSLLFNSSTI